MKHTLVYAATDSPLLSALSMFGPSADRLPPRATITGSRTA
ncbi:hypothetical protein [Streptomyces vastus]